MRDPWKALAAALAVALGAVIAFRWPVPEPATPTAQQQSADAPRVGEAAQTVPSDALAVPSRALIADGAERVQIALLLRLTDEVGAPLQGYAILRLPDGEQRWVAASGGTGAAIGLPPGRVGLQCSALGYYDKTEEVLLPEWPSEHEHTVALERSARIAVRFLAPDGRPLSEALNDRLPAHRAGELRPWLYATASAVLPELAPTGFRAYQSRDADWAPSESLFGDAREQDGILSLRSRPPLLLYAMLRNRVVAATALETVVDRLDLVVDPDRLLAESASIRLRLLDGVTGEPIADGSMSLMSSQGGSTFRCEDGSGVYAATALPPGPVTVQARSKDRAAAARVVLLQPGTSHDLGDVRTATQHELLIRVTDAKGVALAGVESRAWNAVASTLLWPWGMTQLKSDASGLIRSPREAGGDYFVSFLPPSRSGLAAASLRHSLPAASDVAVEVRLQVGHPVTLHPVGDDAFHRMVWLMVDGVAPAGGWRHTALPIRTRLARGEHLWILTDPAGQELRRGVIRVDGATEELRVEVPLP